MRALFLRIERATTALATALASAMLIAAAALGLWQIVTRFVIQQPAEWTEVLIRFTLIWMVFFGIAAAFRHGAMVAVDALERAVGARGQRVLDALVAAASLLLLAVVVWVGWDYAGRGRVQSVIGLEGVSMFWAYVAMPVGGVFAALAVVAQWLDPRRAGADS